MLLWGLGVGSVISGEIFGWNVGRNAGGWGGLLIATATMATLCSTMMMSIAETSTAMPSAGGPYAFARRAMGRTGGYATGLAVVIEYVLAPAVIAIGISGYVTSWLPVDPEMERPYRTPGAPLTPGIARALSLLVMVASLFYQPQVAFMVLGVLVIYGVGFAYYWFYSRHRLVADAPAEEFALMGRS